METCISLKYDFERKIRCFPQVKLDSRKVFGESDGLNPEDCLGLPNIGQDYVIFTVKLILSSSITTTLVTVIIAMDTRPLLSL